MAYGQVEVPVCAQIMCRPLPRSTNAIITGNCSSGIVGTTCNYQCLRGYTLTSGSLTLLCKETGDWSGSPPTCEPILCPTITRSVND